MIKGSPEARKDFEKFMLEYRTKRREEIKANLAGGAVVIIAIATLFWSIVSLVSLSVGDLRWSDRPFVNPPYHAGQN